jgi:glycosyltransferase involved in cell wall biosynthesis
MRRHSLVVLPSRWDEPFGKTILEARLARAIIITTRTGGIPEILEDYPSSVMLDPTLDDESFVARLTDEIRRWIDARCLAEAPDDPAAFPRRFAPEEGVRRYRDLYARAIEGMP